MKKFKVDASFSTMCSVEIEAENEADAYRIALELSGDNFEPAGADYWKIENVSEVSK